MKEKLKNTRKYLLRYKIWRQTFPLRTKCNQASLGPNVGFYAYDIPRSEVWNKIYISLTWALNQAIYLSLLLNIYQQISNAALFHAANINTQAGIYNARAEVYIIVVNDNIFMNSSVHV
jgi:hypothetical protein